jgi:hypothetical protein
MRRRQLSIFLNVLLVVLGMLLVPPAAFRLVQQRTLPLFLAALVLTIGARVWLKVLERPPSPKRIWDSSRPPYPGLESFVEQDAGIFFGREPQIIELLERLHPTLPEQAQRFVAVIGPSGVGKSSLVQAGLLPRLAQRRTCWVALPPLVPGEQPTRSLARSLVEVLPDAEVQALERELAAEPQMLDLGQQATVATRLLVSPYWEGGGGHTQGAQEVVEHLGGSQTLGRFVAMQVHVELQVWELRGQLMRQVHRQGGLAHPRSPGDGGDHHRLRRALGHHGAEGCQLGLPAGEVGHLRRELMRRVERRSEDIGLAA